MASATTLKISMILLWLLIEATFQSMDSLEVTSTSSQQAINSSKDTTGDTQEEDKSMEDLDIFYEYLDDSETDFDNEGRSEKLPELWNPEYDEEFETSQPRSNNITSKECTTDSSKDRPNTPAVSTEEHISTVTSDPNVSGDWEDEKYLNLGLNPKIEVSIEILHEEVTARPQSTSSSMTSADPYDQSPTTATRPTDSSRITPKTTIARNLGLLPFAIRALDKDLRPIEKQNGNQEEVDFCDRWLHCPGEQMLLEMARLQDLPNCPCMYSFDIHYKDEIWDSEKKHNYRWRDASGPNDHLDIFHAGARWCIRSLISDGSSSSMAAQKCCYDHKRHLITRGNGAGTPYFISPEVSRELHHKVDVIPWIICKGDWTRYHIRRSPNNGMQCRKNPSDNVYFKQIQKAKNYR